MVGARGQDAARACDVARVHLSLESACASAARADPLRDIRPLVRSNPGRAVRKPRTQLRRAVVPLAPETVEAIRSHLPDHGHRDGATLVSLLGYAGLRPEEALAVQWRLAPARPPDDAFRFPGATPQRPCRDHDYRNWRKRHFRPAAIEAGAPNGRPYDLRHSFASLMLHEGRVGIVDLASQLGHSPTMTLNTYGRVIAELREAPKRSAAEQIERARRTPRGPQEPLHNQKNQSRHPDSNRGPLHYE